MTRFQKTHNTDSDLITKGHHLVGVKWPVTGSTGRPYEVQMWNHGFTCTCIAFRKCKHIKYVEKLLTKERKVDITMY